MKKNYRGGKRQAGSAARQGDQNAKPVKTGSQGFGKTAKAIHPKNLERVPMRGGIRL